MQRNIGGAKSQNRTYPDLLKDAHDEALFDYYCSSLVRPAVSYSPSLVAVSACLYAAARGSLAGDSLRRQ